VGPIVAGGIALVAGLWLASLFAVGAGPWALGIVLVGVGIAGLAAGIASER